MAGVSDVEKPPLSAPDEWDTFEGTEWKWGTIQMKELVYSELTTDVAAAIEQVIDVRECNRANLKRVEKVDATTIEIVWYDDIGDGDGSKPSHVYSRYIDAVHDRIQNLFGEHWQVRRKPDGRRKDGDHPQRATVRRADHQRFRYLNESHSEYLAHLHGRPRNAPEEASRYGDLDHFPDIEDQELQHLRDDRDVWVYDAGTGTKHLVRGIRGLLIGVPGETECAREIDAETLVDGEGIRHYAEVLADLSIERFVGSDTEWLEPSRVRLDPQHALGEALCDRCWRSYADTVKWPDGTVKGYEPPSGNYSELLKWVVDDV